MNTFTSNSNNQPIPGVTKPFYGKYRGKVVDNLDPLFLGRIVAYVPAVSASVLNWALPCTPYAGFQVGFYAIPPIAANVWIEFEGGDPKYPIWVGGFWSEGEVPEGPDGPATPLVKIFRTEFNTLYLNDTPEVGGTTLLCIPPAVDVPLSMIFNAAGVEVTAPPATFTMVCEEGITLEYPPSTIAMTAETIEVAIPESSLTLTEEGTELLAGDVSITASEAIELTAAADVSIEAGGACEITAGADASMTAGGACEVTGGADVSIEAGAACEVTAGADVAITAAGACELTSADLALTAAATEVTSAAIALTGAVEVTGVLLIDGQVPLMI